MDANIALLGCGYWGKNLARNLHALGALKLICDPSEVGRANAAKTVPGVKVANELGAALADDTIKAVAIATPAETHFDLASQAMESGRDVFVEKPMALHSSEGEQLARAADGMGRILMVGHLLEYHPAVLRLRELVDAGELGPVNYIYSNRLNFGRIRTEENALWSFAPHDVAIILRLLGEMPAEVTCTGGSYITPNLADATVSTMSFKGGQRAHVFVSWLNPFKEQKLVIMAEQKMAVFNDMDPAHKLVLYNQRVDHDGQQPILQRNGKTPVEIATDEPLRLECEHFIECIATRRQSLTNGNSAIRVLRVLEACQQSLQTNGQPVSLDVN